MLDQILKEDRNQVSGARSLSSVWFWGWLVALLGWIGWTIATQFSRESFSWVTLGTVVLLPCALLIQHLASSFSWPTWIRGGLLICSLACLASSVYLSNQR
ncbi:hypothetical protein SAMN02745166_04753 [Prosthecobacter debontii]|uniref:Uncharacterized protein n=1 Tax=Prosthecobacter debontii TaxID=48467 RepID=A0A1T4Z2A5_9BACT|nr:hypothetical protein SAMN02745166_04753 [Prosthecobacter debontii]